MSQLPPIPLSVREGWARSQPPTTHHNLDKRQHPHGHPTPPPHVHSAVFSPESSPKSRGLPTPPPPNLGPPLNGRNDGVLIRRPAPNTRNLPPAANAPQFFTMDGRAIPQTVTSPSQPPTRITASLPRTAQHSPPMFASPQTISSSPDLAITRVQPTPQPRPSAYDTLSTVVADFRAEREAMQQERKKLVAENASLKQTNFALMKSENEARARMHALEEQLERSRAEREQAHKAFVDASAGRHNDGIAFAKERQWLNQALLSEQQVRASAAQRAQLTLMENDHHARATIAELQQRNARLQSDLNAVGRDRESLMRERTELQDRLRLLELQISQQQTTVNPAHLQDGVKSEPVAPSIPLAGPSSDNWQSSSSFFSFEPSSPRKAKRSRAEYEDQNVEEFSLGPEFPRLVPISNVGVANSPSNWVMAIRKTQENKPAAGS
ncbi:hypothetical protein MIND_00661800 [Mycena indigotica]|uniref:Uncharacterized protein n=1 Tax=Mycena indigotica TaxID=2126181 RepID=A0A8H6SMJ9_9AGAR|nr:uncharacterized protein MIND_00661800 [Mycena indigotica]KAF7300987.1 hypothetical protein MIND_00661800 [Mycena indigotica]